MSARRVRQGGGGRPPVELEIDVISEGRTTATAVVSARQGGKRCITVTLFTDVPSGDVIRHHLPRPDVAGPADSKVSEMPMIGRQLRLVDVVDVNSPDEVGPPELYAWLHYDPIPARDDLARALIAYFSGHLGISTTMRAHQGIGTAQAHLTVSTSPMTVTVSFHEPVRWDGWILYTHESTQVGSGMSYVRGALAVLGAAARARRAECSTWKPSARTRTPRCRPSSASMTCCRGCRSTRRSR